MRWEITIATDHREKGKENKYLNECLAEGWEPFAVTESAWGKWNYHLKRPVVFEMPGASPSSDGG